MQCEDFEDRLNAVLDEHRRPECDSELRTHCEACTECRLIASGYRRLLDGFYALTTPEAPADLPLCVLAELPRQVSIRRRFTVATAALAMAAGLLIAVLPLLRWTPESRDAARDVAAASPRGVTAAQQASLESLGLSKLPIVPELLALGSPHEDSFADLAKETGQSLATVMLYVPGVGGAKGIMDVDPDQNAEEPAWALQMSEGLKPIADSMTETVNLLLRAIPVTLADARS